MKTIEQDLKNLADPDYQAFQSKLVPNIDANLVLGVRAPVLRKYAKDLTKTHRDEHLLRRKQSPW